MDGVQDGGLLICSVQAALAAGAAIMEIYESTAEIAVQHKRDDSPLTEADRASHEVLYHALSDLGGYPILSEEGKALPWGVRQTWSRYWLIDPLDGTKEFVKRNGEFTVNIALVENGRAVLGVVYAPALNTLYYSLVGVGAFKLRLSDTAMLHGLEATLACLLDVSEQINVAPLPAAQVPWRIVGSRSHQSVEFKDFVKQFPAAEILSMGSSLKLCLVAEGSADLYPRLGLTSEWDTAAAQAIVEAAGGLVLNAENGCVLQYNQKEVLLNPFFIVCSARATQWHLPCV